MVPRVVQFSSIKFNSIQFSSTQHNTRQHNAMQYSTVQYNTIQDATQCNTALQARIKYISVFLKYNWVIKSCEISCEIRLQIGTLFSPF